MNNCDLSLLRKVGLALCVGMILQTTGLGQCANNLATRTYDTSLTSNGFNIFNLSFPKWSPDSGLLVSARLTAEVSSLYSFTLRNADVQPATYNLSVGQEDQFISPQLLSPFTSITAPQAIGSYPLLPGQTIAQGPITFLDRHLSTDSVTSIAPFLGSDKVTISYMSFTYTNLSTINNASYYYGATINNTMRFTLQYLYCKSAGVLATNLTRWTAELLEPRTARLEWSIVNETAGRQYHIQRSSDGQRFTDVATLSATPGGISPDYAWSDPLPDGAAGTMYYRLQMDDNGSLTYSPVRQLDIKADASTLRIYPNPATDFINLAPGLVGNWQVDILSANGSLVQRETFPQTATMHLTFRNKMSAGTYFVRMLDLRGQKSYTSSFIVTGSY